ncbi:MAG: DUF1398 family protein [Cyclobacteriaceae bacterium]|nr:DUF1398 family protein [Cyclobacteriaceae bacterium]
MFTIERIERSAFQIKKRDGDFPQLVQDLKAIGVTHYDYFVSDGITKYYGTDNFVLKGEATYPSMNVNGVSSSDKLKHAISIHQQGQTDYPTFCKQAAEAGVEKWTTSMINMTVTYLDKAGHKLTSRTYTTELDKRKCATNRRPKTVASL